MFSFSIQVSQAYIVIYAALFRERHVLWKLIKDILLYEGGRDGQGMWHVREKDKYVLRYGKEI